MANPTDELDLDAPWVPPAPFTDEFLRQLANNLKRRLLTERECDEIDELVRGYKRARAASAPPSPDGVKDGEVAELRPVVLWFAREMERVLRRNDHKGGWSSDSAHSLLRRLREETEELERVIDIAPGGYHPALLLDEAADVANFAMMIADIATPGERVPGAPTGGHEASLVDCLAVAEDRAESAEKRLAEAEAENRRLSAIIAEYAEEW